VHAEGSDPIREAARLLAGRRNAVALTGAGTPAAAARWATAPHSHGASRRLPATAASRVPPRNSTSCSRANRSAPPRPKISVASPQCGHTKALMFSTIPMIGTFSRLSMASALPTSDSATSCGVVTSTVPLIGTAWASVSWASDVPGGRSTTR